MAEAERSVYNLTPDAGCQLAVLFIRNTTWSKILSRMWSITTNRLWVDIYESQSWASLRLSRFERRYHTCVVRNVKSSSPRLYQILFISTVCIMLCQFALFWSVERRSHCLHRSPTWSQICRYIGTVVSISIYMCYRQGMVLHKRWKRRNSCKKHDVKQYKIKKITILVNFSELGKRLKRFISQEHKMNTVVKKYL